MIVHHLSIKPYIYLYAHRHPHFYTHMHLQTYTCTTMHTFLKCHKNNIQRKQTNLKDFSYPSFVPVSSVLYSLTAVGRVAAFSLNVLY